MIWVTRIWWLFIFSSTGVILCKLPFRNTFTFIYLYKKCVTMHISQCTCEGRTQLLRVGFPLPLDSGDWTQVISFGIKCLYLLNQLSCPLENFITYQVTNSLLEIRTVVSAHFTTLWASEKINTSQFRFLDHCQLLI